MWKKKKNCLNLTVRQTDPNTAGNQTVIQFLRYHVIRIEHIACPFSFMYGITFVPKVRARDESF